MVGRAHAISSLHVEAVQQWQWLRSCAFAFRFVVSGGWVTSCHCINICLVVVVSDGLESNSEEGVGKVWWRGGLHILLALPNHKNIQRMLMFIFRFPPPPPPEKMQTICLDVFEIQIPPNLYICFVFAFQADGRKGWTGGKGRG